MDPKATSLDKETCVLIIILAELQRVAQRFIKLRKDHFPWETEIPLLLALRCNRALTRFFSNQVRPLTEILTDCQSQTQTKPPATKYVLITDYDDPAYQHHPFTWVELAVRDPLNDPDPGIIEPSMWRLLALFDAFTVRIERWGDLFDADEQGATLNPALLQQLAAQLETTDADTAPIYCEIRRQLPAAEQLERESASTAADLDVPIAARPADPNLIILGSPTQVPLYTKIGKDAAGRTLALSLMHPLLLLVLGAPGRGKSHLLRLIIESLHLLLPNINNLVAPLRSATFEVEHQRGEGRRQMLRGLFPNPDEGALPRLRQHFDCNTTNAAFLRATLRCLPDSLKILKQQLPAYIERGLEIHPIELGPQNLAQAGYEAILGSSLSKLSDRPRYSDFLAGVIGEHGESLTPKALYAIVESSGLFPSVKASLLQQLRPLIPLCRVGADVRHDFYNPWPVFYLLESPYVSQSFLLGLLVALMNALSMPSSDPRLDVMIWLLCDELSKLIELPALARLLFLFGQEIRQRKTSLCLAGQRSTNLPRGLLGVASGVFQFAPNSAPEFEPLRDLHWFKNLDVRSLLKLPTGQAHAAFRDASDPSWSDHAQWLWLRDTVIDPGGKTLTAL